ncbi:uncharacterized protein LOC116775063 [Danaus plexippus]|uniref:uncharacterized protein LOC116775063 n=1 Tax=Danaus plexippus TaxID=13037 RepID=UPI002AB0BD90|nr:uncharacterized protein LOC116775063 [Danaus plexippus]
MAWIVLIFLNLFVAVNSILLNPQQSCVPTTTVKGPCHVCVCDTRGVFICHAIKCKQTKVNPRISVKGECQPKMTYRYEELFCMCSYEGKWMSFNCRQTFRRLQMSKTLVKHPMRTNITSNITKPDKKNLPQIREGEKCVAGRLYKMSCNTCRCGENHNLICSKMACVQNPVSNPSKVTKEYLRSDTKGSDVKQKKKSNKKEKVRKRAVLPKLPKGACVPGKLYTKGCKKCYCTNEKSPVCTTTCANNKISRLSDQDIAEIEGRSEYELPQLPHVGVECEPGQSYLVECNVCFCSERRDLFCTMKYCLNVKSYSENALAEYEGKPCVSDFKKYCMNCKCVNKKSSCNLLKNCNSIMTGRQLLTDGDHVVKLALDVKKDHCTPNVTYKVHCNDCYCQPEGDLRCTQKMCLTYSQTKQLQDREEYLEKHGL